MAVLNVLWRGPRALGYRIQRREKVLDVLRDLPSTLIRPVDLGTDLTTLQPYPPSYPKMPGEPKRVQPSRERGD